MRRRNTYHHHAMRMTDHHVDGTKRQFKPNTSLPRLIAKSEVNQLTVIHMTFDMPTPQDIPDRSTNREDVPRHVTVAIYSDMTDLVMRGLKVADGPHQSYVTIWPDIEAPHNLIASPTKSWNMSSEKGSNP